MTRNFELEVERENRRMGPRVPSVAFIKFPLLLAIVFLGDPFSGTDAWGSPGERPGAIRSLIAAIPKVLGLLNSPE